MPGLHEYSEFASDALLHLMLQAYLADPDDSITLTRTFTDDDFTLTARWGYRPDQVQRALSVLRGEAADAPIAEKLKACLYALSTDESKAFNASHFLTPELQQAAQLLLNELLMAHPILLHPNIRVHVYEQETSGVCSVAHAITLSQRARFPMRRDGVTKAQQAEWVSKRLVTMGLTCKSFGFKSLHPMASMKSPAAVLRQTRHWPTWALASLHELSDSTFKEGDALSKYTVGLLPFHPEKTEDDLAAGVYAMSLVRAMGVIDGTKCPELLESSRALKMPEWPLFKTKMTFMLTRHVFGGMDGAVVHGSITERTQLLLTGLVESGYAEDARKAVALLCDSFAACRMRELATPEILEVLRVFKGTGTRFFDLIPFVSAGSLPEWAEAAEVLEREETMRKVIDAQPSNTPVQAPPRRRAGI